MDPLILNSLFLCRIYNEIYFLSCKFKITIENSIECTAIYHEQNTLNYLINYIEEFLDSRYTKFIDLQN